MAKQKKSKAKDRTVVTVIRGAGVPDQVEVQRNVPHVPPQPPPRRQGIRITPKTPRLDR